MIMVRVQLYKCFYDAYVSMFLRIRVVVAMPQVRSIMQQDKNGEELRRRK